jgi:hypothetical protein
MKRLGIQGYVRKTRYPAAPGHEHKVYPQCAEQTVPYQRPLQKAVSDIPISGIGGSGFSLSAFSTCLIMKL